jgi:hypothetical protein
MASSPFVNMLGTVAASKPRQADKLGQLVRAQFTEVAASIGKQRQCERLQAHLAKWERKSRSQAKGDE